MKTTLRILAATGPAAILALPIAAFAGGLHGYGPVRAPEFDSTMATAGITLATGLVAFVVEHFRRRKK